MAGVSDCFTLGSVVSCKTCYNNVIEGEVQAFDPQTKMLILKCPAQNGRSTLNDVFVINLSYVSDVQVKKEVTSPPEQSKQPLNLHRLNNRLKNTVEQKKRLIMALQAGATIEGQQLYLTICKTLDTVNWQGPNIIVLDKITIKPPYKPEDIEGDVKSKAYIHVRKIVEKHIKDSKQTSKHGFMDGNESNKSSPTSSSSPATTPSQ